MFIKIIKYIYKLIFDFMSVLFVVILIVSLIAIFNYKYIKFCFNNERFDSKIYYSPSKKHSLTLLLHTVGFDDCYTHPYIIQGEYNMEKIPTTENFIEFYPDSRVLIEWENDDKVNIYGLEPISNTLDSKIYVINLVNCRESFDELKEKGKKFIRNYSDM